MARRSFSFPCPGAFTPTCSAKHLPGYVDNAAASSQGRRLDRMPCRQRRIRHVGVGQVGERRSDVIMLADGNGDYTKSLGLELDASGFGMGTRGQRFSLIVDNGTVTNVNIEPPWRVRYQRGRSRPRISSASSSHRATPAIFVA